MNSEIELHFIPPTSVRAECTSYGLRPTPRIYIIGLICNYNKIWVRAAV